MEKTSGLRRRELLAASLAGAVGMVAATGLAAEPRSGRFDRAAYDRYVALMNAGDPRVVDFYAEDVAFVMGIRGRAAVRDFYARHRPYVRESLEVLFFCADATGAAAEVRSTMRCLKDCDDTGVFGRALKAGEVMRTHGFLVYVLNPQGLIAEVKGPPPEMLQPWRIEAG